MCWLLYNTVVQLLSEFNTMWCTMCLYFTKTFFNQPHLELFNQPHCSQWAVSQSIFLIVICDRSEDISQTLVREIIDIYLWLYSVLLTLSDPIVFFWCAAGLYLHSVTRCKASCCPRGWAGPSPLIRLNRCDSITPLEPHRKISLTLHTADVSDAWFVRVLLTLAIC